MSDKKIIRTTAGLRDMLFDELEAFREGKSSIKRAQTIINFTREIIQSSRLEIVMSALVLEEKKYGKKTKHTLSLT